jgi:hypothetical protein
MLHDSQRQFKNCAVLQMAGASQEPNLLAFPKNFSYKLSQSGKGEGDEDEK